VNAVAAVRSLAEPEAAAMLAHARWMCASALQRTETRHLPGDVRDAAAGAALTLSERTPARERY